MDAPTNLTVDEVLRLMLLVTEKQVEQALKRQEETKRKIGEVLVEMGFVEQAEVDNALVLQERLRSRSKTVCNSALKEMSARAMSRIGERQERIVRTP